MNQEDCQPAVVAMVRAWHERRRHELPFLHRTWFTFRRTAEFWERYRDMEACLQAAMGAGL